jgi:predicted esterase
MEPARPAGETVWLKAEGLRLKTRIYRSATLDQAPTLIVVLHGDSPFAPPSYQYRFAQQVTDKIENAVVAPILRPGYADDTGDRSDGKRGLTTGDNYTPEVVRAVAIAVEQLKARFHPAHTVVVGHSGGAAIAADILGQSPSVADAALLVSCPCDLSRWRMHMLKRQANPMWLIPVSSISPLAAAGNTPASLHVHMIVGSEDDVAPRWLTQEYADALRKHEVNVGVTVAPGLKHDILLQPVVVEQLKALVGILSAAQSQDLREFR